jgi:hypothetical protein
LILNQILRSCHENTVTNRKAGWENTMNTANLKDDRYPSKYLDGDPNKHVEILTPTGVAVPEPLISIFAQMG